MKKLALALCTLAILSTSVQNLALAATQPSGNGPADRPQFNKEQMKQHMQKEREAIDNRLNLTKEQKAQAKKIREEGRAQIEPIITQMKAEREKPHQLRESAKSSGEGNGQCKEQAKAAFEKMKALRQQANALREQNMQKFEAILTPVQKAEFQKIKAEMKAKREQMKKEFRENHPMDRGHNGQPPFGPEPNEK